MKKALIAIVLLTGATQFCYAEIYKGKDKDRTEACASAKLVPDTLNKPTTSCECSKTGEYWTCMVETK